MTENSHANRAPAPGQLERVSAKLLSVHDGEEISYACCPANGCFDCCVLKVHHKDGRVLSVTTDDLINKGSGREDSYTSIETLKRGLYQRRACTRGRGQKADLYKKNRILYPYMRDGERGTRNFKRIQWTEALDRIAEAYSETRAKYGPYSIYCDGATGFSMDPFAGWLDGGIAAWGTDSYEACEFADQFIFGAHGGSTEGGTDGFNVLHSKLIILWGFDPAVNNTELYYPLVLAKEKGIPIIVIDPRYNFAAQSLATQYIPIRPGTDITMMMAMMYVMFDEGLINHEYVEKFVEPKGLAKYKAYIMGNDGEPKTPEWASEKCGVPADTIRGLARLYAKSTPCYLRIVWGMARALRGKEVARAAAYLVTLAGNVGVDGGVAGVCNPGCKQRIPLPPLYFGGQPPTNLSPCIMEAEQWSTAVLLKDKVDRGLMTEEEYKGRIGCPAGLPAPNIKMLWQSWQSARNFAINWQGANERLKALKMLDHVIYGHWTWNNSTAYSDIILPYSSWVFEGGYGGQYKGPFYSVLPGNGTGNLMVFNHRIVKEPGEARHPYWIEQQVAKRLGIGDKVKPMLDVDDYEDFQAAYEQACKDAYTIWACHPDIAPHNPPDWEDFLKEPVFRIPVEDNYVFHREKIEDGVPFETPSGKIEFYSEALADSDLTKTVFDGGKCFGAGVLPPMGKWRPNPIGYFSEKTSEYPLYMLTPHSIYRQHTYQDDNPLFRDEFRNSVWISVADAKARNIKDGDMVSVFNEVGNVIVPAYVTSSIVPGTCSLSFGRFYEPSGVKTDLMPDGVDMRGSCNFLVPNEFYDDVQGLSLNTGLVEIQKVNYTDEYPNDVEEASAR